jgi:cell division protein FtsW
MEIRWISGKKHCSYAIGFTIIFYGAQVPYHYFKLCIAKRGLYFVWLLFSVYVIQSTVIAGANASRWIQIPFVELLSALNSCLHGVVYICSSFFIKKKEAEPSLLRHYCGRLWLPVLR